MQSNSEKPKGQLKERAYLFALAIIRLIDVTDNKDRAVDIISHQLLRSATSIGANVIEAQAGRTKKDFGNFFSHALKSANETKFWLCLLRDSGKAKQELIEPLLQEATELANMLASSVLTLAGKK